MIDHCSTIILPSHLWLPLKPIVKPSNIRSMHIEQIYLLLE